MRPGAELRKASAIAQNLPARCGDARDPGACFAAFDAWQRQLQVVQPVGFGFIQPLQLVADLAQQVFPPRNVGVGFDAQRRGAIHHAEHAAAQLRLRDDHLCRVGRSAIDAADLRHRAHLSQHVDGKEPVAQEDQESVAGADGQYVVACEGED